MSLNKVMVVGSGIMGSGIAQAFMEAGFKVYLTDVSREFSERDSPISSTF